MPNKKLKISFRFANTTDIRRLVEINIDGDESYRKRNEKMFLEIIPQKRVITVLVKREIVGLLYWRNEFLGRSNQWYLKQITIVRKWRNRGLGLKLLKYFLAYAKRNKIEKVFADTHNDNFSTLIVNLKAGGLISGFIEGVGRTKQKDERVIFRFEL